MLGFTAEAKGEVEILCRRPEGSQEIHSMRTTGPWGPCQRGSLGVVLCKVIQAPTVSSSPQVSLVMTKSNKISHCVHCELVPRYQSLLSAPAPPALSA